MTMSAMQAFDIYADKVGGRSFDGKPLKRFHDMPDVQKAGWQAVATAANQLAADAVALARERDERRRQADDDPLHTRRIAIDPEVRAVPQATQG